MNAVKIEIGAKGAGLTNQIGYMITGIIKSIRTNKKLILLDDFNAHYEKISPIPMGQIIDLKILNEQLSSYGIYIFDSTFKWEILEVKYGCDFSIIDITNKFKLNFKSLVPKTFNLNDIDGDPFPNKVKSLFIKYKINDGWIFNIQYSENRENDIILDLHNMEIYNRSCWIDMFDVEFYNFILKNLVFDVKFKQSCENFMYKNFDHHHDKSRLNVIHVRDDQDALEFWSQINKMDFITYKVKLFEKYKSIIDEKFNLSLPVLVITSNIHSPVISYLKNKGYKYSLTDKTENRELDGIVDLLAAENCSSIFIGNYNKNLFLGSTFSYFIQQRLSNVDCIMIDLDNIDGPYYSFYH